MGGSVGKELTCQRELGNLVDPFAVASLKNGDVVGHIPWKISSVCCTFLRNRTITRRVIGSPRYSANLPQGGLEVPATLHLSLGNHRGNFRIGLIFVWLLVVRIIRKYNLFENFPEYGKADKYWGRLAKVDFSNRMALYIITWLGNLQLLNLLLKTRKEPSYQEKR